MYVMCVGFFRNSLEFLGTPRAGIHLIWGPMPL